jgi:hypothetical protein
MENRWRIWYVDSVAEGTTVEDWTNLPNTGVLCVMECRGELRGFRLFNLAIGSDWYWMLPDGTIYECLNTADEPGEWVEANAPEGAILKAGSWASNERMDEVINEIKTLTQVQL